MDFALILPDNLLSAANPHERVCACLNPSFATSLRMTNFFAYGSLQLPEVLLAVTGQSIASQPAVLLNYARYRLRDKSFPGIRPEPGALVDGRVYWHLDRNALARLDRFEDDFYHRETVFIATADGKEWAAEAYVMNRASHAMLLPEPWSLADFKRDKLAAFLLSHE